MIRKVGKWLVFLCCLILFVIFRFHALSKTSIHSQQDFKPEVPPPITISRTHPWLQIQPNIQGAALEIVHDMEMIHYLSTRFPGMQEEDMERILMEKLLPLQAQIPFSFPDCLYNVLCIPETNTPFPCHIYKRLYLGETDLGMPCYLDVRVFELNTQTAETIIDAHLHLLEGPQEKLTDSGNRKTYFCRGVRSSSFHDLSHGFAGLQGERGLFLDCWEKDGKLFMCFAEAPLNILEKFISIYF